MAAPDDDLSTAVLSATIQEELHVFPVPAHDELFVALHGARGAITCSIMDSSGRSVQRAALGGPFGSINIAQLAPGLYTLMCADGEHAARAVRFVVD